MRWKHGLVAAGVLLVSSMGPASAQRVQPRMDPPPEEPMARMMTMMQQMRAEMQTMHEQMGSMQGMGPMRGNMDRMIGSMGEMRSMTEQHRQQMMQQCSGFKGPMSPKSGG